MRRACGSVIDYLANQQNVIPCVVLTPRSTIQADADSFDDRCIYDRIDRFHPCELVSAATGESSDQVSLVGGEDVH
jgi:hypothetical protein